MPTRLRGDETAIQPVVAVFFAERNSGKEKLSFRRWTNRQRFSRQWQEAVNDREC